LANVFGFDQGRRRPHNPLGVRADQNAMPATLPFLTTLLLVVTGAACRESAKPSDVTPQLIAALKKYGATPVDDHKLPLIRCEWTYKEDADGFVVTLKGDHFKEIDGLLQSRFGKPYMWTDKADDGQPHAVFHPNTAGVAIQYGVWNGSTRVICVKKQVKSR